VPEVCTLEYREIKREERMGFIHVRHALKQAREIPT